MTTGRTPQPENGDRWAGSVPSLPVAWLCGLLYGVGLFLPLLLIASLAVAALATFGAFNGEAWILLAAGLGLLMTAVGPGLMAATSLAPGGAAFSSRRRRWRPAWWGASSLT